MPRLRILVVGGLALGAWCGWASGFHTDSAAAVTTWCVSLGIVLCVDLSFRSRNSGPGGEGPWLVPAEPWPRPGRGGPGPALRGVSPWLLLIGVSAAWDVLGNDTGPQQAHLTISALAQAFRPVSAALLFVWMLVGIGYGVARVRRPPVAPPDAGAASHELAAVILPLGGRHDSLALLLPSSRPVGLLFWGAACAAAIMIDQAARRSRGTFATSGDFGRFTSSAAWANILLIAGWTFAGFHLFAR